MNGFGVVRPTRQRSSDTILPYTCAGWLDEQSIL
jgi:hypothetical protein